MEDRARRQPSDQQAGPTVMSLVQGAIPGKTGISIAMAVAGGLAILLGTTLALFLQELRGNAFTVIAIGGILLLAALMLSFAEVRQAVIGRRGRYGTNTLVMIMALTALALLVYVVAVRNTARWDITATRQFSLAQQTRDILKNLAQPIQATAFFVPGEPEQEQYRASAENLLNEFRHRSSNKFSYRFFDPDRNPTLANRYRVTEYPTIVFEEPTSGTQYNLTAPFFQERDFTSAILIVTGKERKRIYYMEGHGEKALQDSDANSHQGFGFAADALSRDNYQILPLSLAQLPEIPKNAAALIFAGPARDLTQEEASQVHAYLKGGGRLLLLLEPKPPQTFKDLLARWALKVDEGTVVDLASSLAGQPQTPLIKRAQYGVQPPVDAITKPLDQSYFPGTTSFRPILDDPAEMPKYILQYPLAATTILSCVTPDPEVTTCPQADFNFRVPAIALQAARPMNEEPDPNAVRETRIVVFGDTDFATNFHLYSQSNSDLFLNSVNWLTEDISLSLVRPKPFLPRFMATTARQMQLIRGLSWIVLPAIMLLLAGVAWWRRR